MIDKKLFVDFKNKNRKSCLFDSVLNLLYPSNLLYVLYYFLNTKYILKFTIKNQKFINYF